MSIETFRDRDNSVQRELLARLDETGHLLMRSGMMIGHTLEAMRAAGDALSVTLEPDEYLFITRLLEVDVPNGTMTIGWSESKEANALIMELQSIAFSANHEGVHFEFAAGNPRQSGSVIRSAIQLALPTTMLAVQRRALPRYRVPPAIPLCCEITLGPMSFEALVVDVSFSGIGAIVYDTAIRLEAGTIIPRARILLPAHPPVLAALELRHVGAVTRADGSVAMRAGCRFIAPGAEIEALVRVFLAAVEAAPGC